MSETIKEKAAALKRAGYCPGSVERAPSPGEVKIDYTAECPLCERVVKVTKAGRYVKHKAVLVPSGWKDPYPESNFFQKGTKYGNKYRCKECRWETLGLGGNMHVARCSKYGTR